MAQVNPEDDDLIPDLDVYFATIAGLASGVHGRKWSLEEVQRYLSYVKRDPL